METKMLVLSRKLAESICIGEGITVTILEVHHGRVRLGIDAPSSVRIQREEVWLQTPDQESATTVCFEPGAGVCQA
jgi:carbon storage regulator